jgi:hypothetical protein
MLYEQVIIKRVGMIEVGQLSKVERKICEVTIIGVLLNKDYFACLYSFQDAVSYRGFSRPGPAGNADD